MESIHRGVGGAHQDLHTLALMISLQGYYILADLPNDLRKITNVYDECQRHTNIQILPSASLTLIVNLVARWGLQIVSLHSHPPQGKGNNYSSRLIISLSEPSQNWCASFITEDSVVQFVFHNIVCRFGVSLKIIMDNETHVLGRSCVVSMKTTTSS